MGKLSGIPFGVKDIIETKGLATEYGSPIYKGRIGTADAAIVRDLRWRGGIPRQNAHCRLCLEVLASPRTTHAIWPTHLEVVKRFGCRCGGGDGAAYHRNTNGWFRDKAGFLLWRDRIQDQLWSSHDGRRAPLRRVPDMGFFTHTAADMLAFWQSIGQPIDEPRTFRSRR